MSNPFEGITNDWYFCSTLNKEVRFISHNLKGITYFIVLEKRDGSNYDLPIKQNDIEKFLKGFTLIENPKEKTEDELINESLRGDYRNELPKEKRKNTKKEIITYDDPPVPYPINGNSITEEYHNKLVTQVKASESVEFKNKVIDKCLLEIEQLKKERTELLENISKLKISNNELRKSNERIIESFPDIKNNDSDNLKIEISEIEKTTELRNVVISDLISFLEKHRSEEIVYSNWHEEYEANNTYYRLNRKIIKFIRFYDFPTVKSSNADIAIISRIKETLICVAAHRLIKPIFDVHHLISQILNIPKEEVLNRIFIDYFYLDKLEQVGDWFYEQYLEFEWKFKEHVLENKPFTTEEKTATIKEEVK